MIVRVALIFLAAAFYGALFSIVGALVAIYAVPRCRSRRR